MENELAVQKTTLLTDMTVFEAKECVAKIKANVQNICELLLELQERKGWEALGYKNWRECVAKEFGKHQSYLYRQLAAAKVERNISDSPIGEIPESHLRPLTSLPPEEQKEIYEKAVETAPEGKVTAKHIEETIRKNGVEKDQSVVPQGNARYEEGLNQEELRILLALQLLYGRASKKVRDNFRGWTNECVIPYTGPKKSRSSGSQSPTKSIVDQGETR